MLLRCFFCLENLVECYLDAFFTCRNIWLKEGNTQPPDFIILIFLLYKKFSILGYLTLDVLGTYLFEKLCSSLAERNHTRICKFQCSFCIYNVYFCFVCHFKIQISLFPKLKIYHK